MPSKTEICNQAISHLAIGKEIGNVETERSQEAAACRRFYETTRDEVLRDFPWPFATSIVALAKVADNPNDEWTISYRYPSDCLMMRRVLSGTRNDTQDTRVPNKVGQDASGLLIFCDRDSAQLEYTVRATDELRYPADFVSAFSLLLAAKVGKRLTGGDPFKLTERALQLYEIAISKAMKNALNEQTPDRTPESEFLRERGGIDETLNRWPSN